ncbi:septal ring lytic transglycosylase RlpA family protein [Trichloromonas sp.]|uniref:septal ring lytic transglycosylase RlpA family protein n=1 Tax=Trichloromonas sp. TaxID=3069249 RepID=UPI003D818A3F
MSPRWQREKIGRLLALVLLLLWVGQPLAAGEPAMGAGGEIGHATYYAKRFAGRRTASGELYDHDKLTAAHSSLPFGTRVRVVNLANGREVTVTVNDRCRPRKIPFIDLSRSAARAIGFLSKGSARVRIIPAVAADPP